MFVVATMLWTRAIWIVNLPFASFLSVRRRAWTSGCKRAVAPRTRRFRGNARQEKDLAFEFTVSVEVEQLI